MIAIICDREVDLQKLIDGLRAECDRSYLDRICYLEHRLQDEPANATLHYELKKARRRYRRRGCRTRG